MNLTITGYSTALFSTWYLIEELGLLFDAGDGIASGLLQKSRKVNHVFISHADRDHLMGLFQFNQLNGREGFPIIHYPKDCGSFPAIEAFSKNFDGNVRGTVWRPIVEHERIWIRDNIFVEGIRNSHVAALPTVSKSLGYKVVEVKKKLKPELLYLPNLEIKRLIQEQGKENTTVDVLTTLFAYSGDTPVENAEHWDNAEILIHEATFLGGEEDSKLKMHGNQHSTLEEVIEMVSTINIGKLILGHFSSRYSKNLIESKVRALCAQYNLKCSVHCVFPSEIMRDILKKEPVYCERYV
jgi:ribonuclease Z